MGDSWGINGPQVSHFFANPAHSARQKAPRAALPAPPRQPVGGRCALFGKLLKSAQKVTILRGPSSAPQAPPAPLSCGPVGATSLGNGVLWDGNSVPWDGNGVPWELVGETSHEKVTNSGKNDPPRGLGGQTSHTTRSLSDITIFRSYAASAPSARKNRAHNVKTRPAPRKWRAFPAGQSDSVHAARLTTP